MTPIQMVAIGMMAGLHGATYGAYKDSPHESFLLRRFLRELLLATAIATVADLGAAGDLPPSWAPETSLPRRRARTRAAWCFISKAMGSARSYWTRTSMPVGRRS